MSDSVSLSRRRALQLLSGMPMLPLASSLANPAQMAETYVASTLTKGVGRHLETYALGYETFFLTGETVPNAEGGMTLAGGYYNINNAPILDTTSPDQRQFFSDCPDGMSLLTLPKTHSRRSAASVCTQWCSSSTPPRTSPAPRCTAGCPRRSRYSPWTRTSAPAS